MVAMWDQFPAAPSIATRGMGVGRGKAFWLYRSDQIPDVKLLGLQTFFFRFYQLGYLSDCMATCQKLKTLSYLINKDHKERWKTIKRQQLQYS